MGVVRRASSVIMFTCDIKTVALYSNGTPHQEQAMDAFYSGLPSDIDAVKLRAHDAPALIHADVSVFWGVRYQKLIGSVSSFIVLERGYFGDRMINTAAGWGGLNGRADFRNKNVGPDRWALHGKPLGPVRNHGAYVLIAGQVAGDMSTHGIDLDAWYAETVSKLHEQTQFPIAFRPHPLSRTNGAPKTTTVLNGTLADALRNAAAVVTYNSNTGVDAALAGVPVYTADRGSMAWDVAAHKLSDLFNGVASERLKEGREKWVNELAYCQWTLDEIREGLAWQHLTRHGDE